MCTVYTYVKHTRKLNLTYIYKYTCTTPRPILFNIPQLQRALIYLSFNSCT